MLPYASIGKINLIPALGLARNMSSEIDRKASGCLSCPYYAAMLRGKSGQNQCATCEKKKTKYQNEKARYGYKPPLTKAELFVFLDLHFCSPSATGVVADVSAAHLAEECKIAVKTAYEALHGLESKTYIHLNTDTRGSYTILVEGYDKYFLPAKEGGRGYVTLTQEIFRQLLSVKDDINAVRYAIRAYIGIDMDASRNPSCELTHGETVRQALSYLPGYFRPCHLKKLLTESLPTMLSMVGEFGKSLVIRLDPKFYGKTVKQDIVGREEDFFGEYLERILDTLHMKENGIISIRDMSETELLAHTSLVRMKGAMKNSFLKPEDLIKADHTSLLSLAQVSLEYGRDRVLDALKKVWADWRPGGADQAAYIRTILSSEPAT